MTSWDRRLSAADRRPTLPTRARSHDPLAAATDAGVDGDALDTLRAVVAVADAREGFRQRVVASGLHRGERCDLVFEVANRGQGPTVALVGPLEATSATSADAEDEGDDGRIVRILTDTLVETPDMVAVFSSVGHEALWANDAFATVIPVRAEDKVWLVELLDEWSKGHYEVKVLPALVKFGRWRGRLTLLSGDGERHVSAVIVAHRDRQGEIEAVSMVARDAAEPPAEHAPGQPAEDPVRARFEALVEGAGELLAVTSPDGVVTWASPAAARLVGLDDESVVGFDVLGLVHPDDRPASLLDLVRPDEQGVGVPVDVRLVLQGETRHLEVIVTDLTGNPAIGGIVLNARDVTERVRSSQALAERAYTDALTGLPNRMRLLDRAARSLQESPGGALGVLVLDLDRFGSVNELFGQPAADALLRTTADRLAEAVVEPAFLARHSGDQFVVLVPGGGDRAELVRRANRLRAVVAEPIARPEGTAELTASVGVLASDGSQEPEQLLRDAGRALAQAKDLGGDRVEVFTEELAAVASRRQTMEQQLRHALDNDGIAAHYQPIVDVVTGEVVAAEALLRVRDGGGQVLNPAELIEAAESSGLMARVGLQVLQATAEQLAAWADVAGAPGEVSVNISPRQLADPDLPSRVAEVLRSAGVAPERLLLEITESILISQHPTVDAAISYLRALGVRVGLDDFGAGRSSLGYLKRFPLDFVKVDRSLVAGLGVDEQDTAIVRATVELAHNLGLEVVAVGVEDEQQREILELLGCQRAQGYLFAPPAPAAELTPG